MAPFQSVNAVDPEAVDPSARTVWFRPLDSGGPSGRGGTEDALIPGEVVFGVYRVEALIGSGAMGSVYRARHIELDVVRAIKLLKAGQVLDRDALLAREARTLGKIRHDAVVEFIELRSDRGGRRSGLVMEFVEGVTLSGRLARGPLDPSEVISLARRLGEALDAIHAEGVAHLDLSPDNIILPEGRADRAMLIDFGIARDAADAGGPVFGGFTGKLRYASPEQLSNEQAVGEPSDAYSLGLVLAAAAIGCDVARSRTYRGALRDRRSPGLLPEGIPKRLRRKLKALLVCDPTRRPSSIANHFAPSLSERWATAIPG